MTDFCGFRTILLALGLIGTAGAVMGGEPGTWTTLQQPAARPLARTLASIATYNGDALLYGGLSPGQESDIALTDFWRYDPAAGSFKRQNSTTPSPPPRYGHASTCVDIYHYAFFGRGESGEVRSDVWWYDFPRLCWEPSEQNGASKPAGRAEHSAVTVGSRNLLIFGGQDGSDALLDDLWSFDPGISKWEPRAAHPGGGRFGHVAAAVDGRMYVLGGTTAGGVQGDVWQYTPQTDSWTQLTSEGELPGRFTGAAGAAGDFNGDGTDEILITAGQDETGADLGDTFTVAVNPGTSKATWTRRASRSPIFQAAAGAFKPGAGATGNHLVLFGGSLNGVATDAASVFSAVVAPPNGADLRPQWGTVTATPVGSGKNQKFKLLGSVQILNSGTEKAKASSVKFLLSEDNAAGAGDRELKSVKVKAIKNGKSRNAKLKITLAPGETVAGKFVIAVADATAKVAESNENNNTAAFGPLP